jgi:hypothetical protein
MDFSVNVATFIRVYSVQWRSLLQGKQSGREGDLSLIADTKELYFWFVWRRSMLPGNQKRARKMTVDNVKGEEINSMGLKTRISCKKVYNRKSLRDICDLSPHL